jgi:copper(I)-binding protein
MRLTRFTAVAILAMFISACSIERVPLVATDVSIKQPMPGMQMTAGYLTLSNNTTQAIKITQVSSPQFDSVEMHESVVEDGMARMYPLGDLTILAGKTVQFEPGGKHLMLMRPVGEFETVTLEFHAGKAIVLTLNVALSD